MVFVRQSTAMLFDSSPPGGGGTTNGTTKGHNSGSNLVDFEIDRDANTNETEDLISRGSSSSAMDLDLAEDPFGDNYDSGIFESTITITDEEKKVNMDEVVEITHQFQKLWYNHQRQPKPDSDNTAETSELYGSVISTAHMATVSLVANNENSIDTLKDTIPNAKLQHSIKIGNTMDKYWTKELYEMDPKEREDIANAFHGVSKLNSVIEEETPESIHQAVQSFRKFIEDNLEEELDNEDSIVPPVTKEPYKRAVYTLGSNYVRSKAFVIKFLRVAFYDMGKAALRYFRYLDLLYELFGDDALTRPLALTDLTKKEMRYLRTGQMQLFPSRDRVGRRIYAFSGKDDTRFNIREKYRVNIYLIDVLSDDVTTQKLGAVTINAPRCNLTDVNPFAWKGMSLKFAKPEVLGGKHTEAQYFRKINEALPVRLSAIHYIAPPLLIYEIGRTMVLTLLGKDQRKIVRFHAGSHLECSYSLRSFGIPEEDITITTGDNIKTKNVPKFINARKSIEAFREKAQKENEQGKQQQQHKSPLMEHTKANHKSRLPPPDDDDLSEKSPGIECPGLDCIVFGDKTMHNLPAGVEFREMLMVMGRERDEKLEINENEVQPIKHFLEEIIKTVRSPKHNFRFLVFDKESNLFVDIDDHKQLCKRVSQALRDQRKRARIGKQRLMDGIRSPSPATNSSSGDSFSSATQLSPSHGEMTLSPVRSSNSNCVLDEAGTSIMGLDAAKRLKRSYADGDCFFCKR